MAEFSAWVLSRSPSFFSTSMAVRSWVVVGVCIVRCECEVIAFWRISGDARDDILPTILPAEFVHAGSDVPEAYRTHDTGHLPQP